MTIASSFDVAQILESVRAGRSTRFDVEWVAHLLTRLISAGFVDLTLVDLVAELGGREKLAQSVAQLINRFSDNGSGAHKELCAISALYCKQLAPDKSIIFDCDATYYAGGRADLALEDHSIFVECGMLSGGGGVERVLSAIKAHQTLLLVPYPEGRGTDAAVGWKFTPTAMYPKIKHNPGPSYWLAVYEETDPHRRWLSLVQLAARSAELHFDEQRRKRQWADHMEQNGRRGRDDFL